MDLNSKELRVVAMQLFDLTEGAFRVLLFLERNNDHESRDNDYYFILVVFNQTTELPLPTPTLLN